MKKTLFLLFLVSVARAENAQLNNAITSVSSQTITLTATVGALSQDEATLINKYHLTNAGQCALLVVGVSTGATVPVSFLPTTSTTTAVQADFTFSSSFTVTGAAIGPAGTAAGKSVSINNVNGVTKFIVFGLNQTPIGPGVLATLSVSSTAPPGIYPITLTNLVASDPVGNTTLLCGTSGAIKR
jgi:hypothetical protein